MPGAACQPRELAGKRSDLPCTDWVWTWPSRVVEGEKAGEKGWGEAWNFEVTRSPTRRRGLPVVSPCLGKLRGKLAFPGNTSSPR